MVGIFAQFVVDDKVFAGFQVYDDSGNVLKSDSNLLGGDDFLLRNIYELAAQFREIYILVSDVYYNKYVQVFEQISQKTKVLRVNDPEIKSKLQIQTQEYRDTHQFLVILYEKIFQENLTNLEYRTYQQKLDILHAIVLHKNFREHIEKTEEFKFHPDVEAYLNQLEEHIKDEKIHKIDLNEEQKRVFQVFYDFIHCEMPAIMLLIGAAGTGKSTLVSYLSRFYKHIKNNHQILLLAPTGKAARVIEMKTRMKCTTVHRAIYFYSREFKYEKKDKQEYVRVFEIQKLQKDAGASSLCIVDEASMLSDFITKEELEHSLSKQAIYKKYINCTGFLLYDIIEFMKQFSNNFKILLVGDNCQLSPISHVRMNENFIPAFETDFLKQKYQDVQLFEVYLKTAYRFASQEIYEFSSLLRDKIYGKSKEYLYTNITDLINQFRAQYYFSTSCDIYKYDELDTFLRKYHHVFLNDKKNAIIITHRNQSADYLNWRIRNEFGFQSPLSPQDLCIATKNNYFYDIMNGELFLTKQLHQITLQAIEYSRLHLIYIVPFYIADLDMVNYEKEKKEVILLQEYEEKHSRLRSVEFTTGYLSTPEYNEEQRLLFQFFQMQSAKKKFVQVVQFHAQSILGEDIRLKNESDDDRLEPKKIVLYKHGKVRHYLSNYINDQNILNYEEFELHHLMQFIDIKDQKIMQCFYDFLDDEYNTNSFFNPLFFRHGYAITCHKAQGSEWDYVFLTDVKNNDFQWIYTALTRGKSKLHILPNFHLHSISNYMYDFYFLTKDFRGKIMEVTRITTTTLNEVAQVIANFLNYSDVPVQFGILELQPCEENLYVLETSRNNVFFVERSRIQNVIIREFQEGFMHNIEFDKEKVNEYSIAKGIEFSYS